MIPFLVPATLKSISPKWSSKPWISVRILITPSSSISPIAIPATGALIGTPASIRASVDPQIDAWDEDPLDDKTSETTLIVYGNSSESGITGIKALSARAPWPISRLPGDLDGFVSPTQNPGKL